MAVGAAGGAECPKQYTHVDNLEETSCNMLLIQSHWQTSSCYCMWHETLPIAKTVLIQCC